MAEAVETDQQNAAPAKRPLEEEEAQSLQIKVTFGKSSLTASRPANSTVAELKREIEQHTGTEGGEERESVGDRRRGCALSSRHGVLAAASAVLATRCPPARPPPNPLALLARALQVCRLRIKSCCSRGS